MSSRRKHRSSATAFGGEQDKRRVRNSKEKLRHRAMMRRLDELVSLVPLDRNVYKTRASKLKRTLEYFYYLEDTVQSICKQRDIPLPLDYQIFLANRSCLSQESCECPRALVKRVVPSIELPYTQTTPSESNDAVVPDMEFPPDIPSSLEQETGEWERYGISKEDWTAAGSSQQNTPQSPDRSVPTGPEKTFVDVICSSFTSTPLKEAPEYFIVSPNGDVTSLGKLPSLSEHQCT